MLSYKFRLIAFLVLIASLSGSSLVGLANGDVTFLTRLLGLLLIQPIVGGLFFLLCFAPEVLSQKPKVGRRLPFER